MKDIIDSINNEYDENRKEKRKNTLICIFKFSSLIVFLGVIFYFLFSLM